MNRAVQMPSRCWEVAIGPDADCGWPHCASKEEALAVVEADDGDVEATVTFLDAPCWEALCLLCGEPLEHDEYGRPHYRSRSDAESDEDMFCEAGCEPSGTGPLAPSTAGMDPLPGLNETGTT